MAVLVTCSVCDREFRAKDQARNLTVRCPGCGTQLMVNGPRVPNHDVFLSYSHKDKSVADAICVTLENRKVRCWMAPRDIAPGADWSSSIIAAIEDARVMLMVFSANSNMSQQVLREVERAVSKGLLILPVRIESVDLSKSMEYFLSACHWLDAFDGPIDEHLKQLSSQVRLMLLSGDAAVANDRIKSSEISKASVSGGSQFVRGMAMAFGLLIVGVAIGVGIHLMLTRPAVSSIAAAVGGPIPAPAPGVAPLPTLALAPAIPSVPVLQAIPTVTTQPAGSPPTAQVRVDSTIPNAQVLPSTVTTPPGKVSSELPKLIDRTISQPQLVLKGHPESIGAIFFLPPDQLVAMGASGDDALVHAVRWDLHTGELLDNTMRAKNSTYSPDGKWRHAAGTLTSTVTGREIPIASVSVNDYAIFSADSSRVMVGSRGDDGANAPVYVFDCVSGHKLFETPPPNPACSGLDFSPDGHHVLVCYGLDGRRIWDVDSGREFPDSAWQGIRGFHAAFSTDGSQLGVVNMSYGLIAVNNVADGRRLVTLPPSTDRDGDCRRIYRAGNDLIVVYTNPRDNTVSLTEPRVTGAKTGILDKHGPLSCMPAFSPDGRKMLVATSDDIVRLFDIENYRQIAEFEGQSGPVNAVRFSPDGRLAASGGEDKTVCVWKIP